MKRRPHFEVFANAKHTRFYVRLVYSNGRKALVSEGNGYTRRRDAKRAAQAMADELGCTVLEIRMLESEVGC